MFFSLVYHSFLSIPLLLSFKLLSTTAPAALLRTCLMMPRKRALLRTAHHLCGTLPIGPLRSLSPHSTEHPTSLLLFVFVRLFCLAHSFLSSSLLLAELSQLASALSTSGSFTPCSVSCHMIRNFSFPSSCQTFLKTLISSLLLEPTAKVRMKPWT